MFGMGFTEILIIAVIAILFIGPDKLPSAMVEIAKIFRSAKNAIGSVKDTIEEEIHVSDIKKEALAYKQELLDTSTKISQATDVKGFIGTELDTIEETIVEQEITFKKTKKTDKKEENIDA